MSNKYAKNYENLANAIIAKAAADYIRADKKLKRDPEDRNANRERFSIERFFMGDLINMYTNMDGEILLQGIRHECAEVAR